MAIYSSPAKRNKFTISYKENEVKKFTEMELYLMEKYCYDRSQLHKELIRKEYKQHLGVL